MLCLYYLSRLLSCNRLSARWRYRIIQAATLYYIVPLPFLKPLYQRLAEWFYINVPVSVESEVDLVYQQEGLFFFDGSRIHVNQTAESLLLFFSIWLLTAVCIVSFRYSQYLKRRRELAGCFADQSCMNEDAEMVEELRQEMGIRRRIKTYTYPGKADAMDEAFTLGILHPVIIYPYVENKAVRRLILEHEMVHIRNWDVLWKMLISLALITHWYNPLLWLLHKEANTVCEMSCDEEVIRDKSSEVIRQYGMMLIDMPEAARMKPGWSASLSESGVNIKERINNMKRQKKVWGRIASAVMVASIVILNSLTVFAYEDINVYKMTTHSQEEAKTKVLEADNAFVSDTMEANVTFLAEGVSEYEMRYDNQFIDEAGNIYPMVEAVPHACNHNYIHGSFQQHQRSDTGSSCTVWVYDAHRCSKCSVIDVHELISTTVYVNCPHPF